MDCPIALQMLLARGLCHLFLEGVGTCLSLASLPGSPAVHSACSPNSSRLVSSGCSLASRSLGSQLIREKSHLVLCCFGYVAMSYKDLWQVALYFIQSFFPGALAQCPGATSLDTQSNTSLCIWNNQKLTLIYNPWPKLV